MKRKKKKVQKVAICFWCQRRKSEVKAGKKKLVKVIKNYHPCDKCHKAMTRGVTFIEATTARPLDGRPQYGKDSGQYPTGRWRVLPESTVIRCIKPDELAKGIIKTGRTFITPENAKAMKLFTYNN